MNGNVSRGWQELWVIGTWLFFDSFQKRRPHESRNGDMQSFISHQHHHYKASLSDHQYYKLTFRFIISIGIYCQYWHVKMKWSTIIYFYISAPIEIMCTCSFLANPTGQNKPFQSHSDRAEHFLDLDWKFLFQKTVDCKHLIQHKKRIKKKMSIKIVQLELHYSRWTENHNCFVVVSDRDSTMILNRQLNKITYISIGSDKILLQSIQFN